MQIHDFNPGDLNPPGEPNHFPDGGVFWTRPVPVDSVVADASQGNAHFHLAHFSTLDYFTVGNALFRNGADPLPATASVDIVWQGTGERVMVENTDQGFSGIYDNAAASLWWSASNSDGYHFSTANSSHVEVAHAFTARVLTSALYR